MPASLEDQKTISEALSRIQDLAHTLGLTDSDLRAALIRRQSRLGIPIGRAPCEIDTSA